MKATISCTLLPNYTTQSSRHLPKQRGVTARFLTVCVCMCVCVCVHVHTWGWVVRLVHMGVREVNINTERITCETKAFMMTITFQVFVHVCVCVRACVCVCVPALFSNKAQTCVSS